MKIIAYNSAVAKLCGKNGIIKAVLLNYVYNYHKPNTSKGAGHPACITLAEFVYQYRFEDTSLWGRSFIHKMLKDLQKDGHVIIARENNLPVYSVSPEVAGLLADKNAVLVSFDLEMACQFGVYIAIVSRFIFHVIKESPNGEAYNLSVNKMSEVNGISPAQIYRGIKYLVDQKVFRRVKSDLKFRSRHLSLARC